jgi:hypothetical protein
MVRTDSRLAVLMGIGAIATGLCPGTGLVRNRKLPISIAVAGQRNATTGALKILEPHPRTEIWRWREALEEEHTGVPAQIELDPGHLDDLSRA